MFRTEWSRDRRADGFSGHVRLRTPTSFRVVAIDKPSKKQERLLPRTCVTLSRNATPFATTGGNPRSGNRRRLCLVRCKGNHVDATETCLSSITLAHYETEKLGQATSAKTRPPSSVNREFKLTTVHGSSDSHKGLDKDFELRSFPAPLSPRSMMNNRWRFPRAGMGCNKTGMSFLNSKDRGGSEE
jgi:hypothetical protein